ncbi:MAG: phospho-N-acetylmuramoyl-pentapeptide-transferase [Streptomycetaceae bacterium]|nr:MAG: phospho-N-acetylmuramoyl-pentapeptide-transferase [Streptomycetaceae bacterium]
MREILIAGAFSLLVSLFGTPILIRWLARHGYGQIIRDDGPKSHHTKRGTPTMGGLIIIVASLVGFFLSHIITQIAVSISAVLVIGLVVSLGALGFIDDWLKVSKQRSLGLTPGPKVIGQTLFAAIFGWLGIHFLDADGLSPISLHLSTVRDTSLTLAPILVVIGIIIMVSATSNGVNLTDGLDGLATGASVMTFLSFILIGVWEFGQSCSISTAVNCYQVRDPLDIAVLAASLAAACTGFLWWNASPAKIFMGDTGSLALGGAIAGIAATLRIELLLIPLGGLFVIITMSVIIQRVYFKASGGKRVFKMAPLQHHFELSGWGEVTIVLRFWIIAGLCVAVGLGLFYAQWVSK